MDAGAIRKWDILELSCTLASTPARSATTYNVSATASLTSSYCTNALLSPEGIIITCETDWHASTPDASGTGSVHIEIPVLGIDETEPFTGGWQSSLVGRVEFDNVQLHVVVIGGIFNWRFRASALRFYANGTLFYTHGSAVDITCNYLTPAGIPLMGLAPILTATGGYGPVPVDGGVAEQCTASSASASAEGTGTGGWRWKEVGSGSWSAPAVNVDPVSIPSVSCPITATATPVTATTTYNGSVAFRAWFEDETVAGTEVTDSGCQLCSNGGGAGWGFTPYVRTLEHGSYGGSVTLLPDLDKSVKRWGDGADYGAEIGRFGLPWTRAEASAQCLDYDDPDDPDYSVTEEYMFPGYAVQHADVLDATHTIELPFSKRSYAPYSYGGHVERARNTCIVTTTFGTCPLVGVGDPPAVPPDGSDCIDRTEDAYRHTVTSVFAPDVQAVGLAAVNPYWEHVEDLPNYINYCVHPHWSYYYYFPYNNLDTDGDGILDAQNEWLIGGDPIANEYFLDTRSQSIIDGARNSLISAPLRDGAYSFWLKSIFGSETSWWGITRWQARDQSPLAEFQLDSDSASAWSATDATLTHGANIVCNPSALSFVVLLDLGLLTVEPYFYVHLAKQILVDWISTNIASIAVYLTSIDGTTKALLTTITGTFAKPITATDLKYAGAWKQDYGAGYIDDEGVDSLPSGISSESMGIVERCLHFLLLGGQLAKQLRFEITCTDHAVDVTLKYPKFIAPTTAPSLYHENGHQSAIVWADGPGIRYGSWRWWDYVGDVALTEPTPDVPGYWNGPLGFKSTTLDLLRWENVVPQASSYDDGITAALAALYDSTEGQTRALAAKDTIGFLVKSNSKLFGVCVNTYSEVPPLAMFPLMARDSDLIESGAYVQEAFCCAQKPRRYVSAKTQIDIYNPSAGVTRTATLGTAPSSWKVSQHSDAMTGSEGFEEVRVGTRKIAQMRPWNGTFCVPPVEWPNRDVAWVSYDVNPSRRHILAIATPSPEFSVEIGTSQNGPTLFFEGNVAGITATAGCVRWAGPDVLLWTVESGTVYQRLSTTEGQTFAVATSIGSGSQVCAVVSPQRLRYIYRRVGTTIVGQVRDAADNLVVADTTVVASGVDDKPIACDYRPLGDGSYQIVLWYVASGTLTEVYSSNGTTFS